MTRIEDTTTIETTTIIIMETEALEIMTVGKETMTDAITTTTETMIEEAFMAAGMTTGGVCAVVGMMIAEVYTDAPRMTAGVIKAVESRTIRAGIGTGRIIEEIGWILTWTENRTMAMIT